MSADDLLQSVTYLIPLILSLTVHEFAHAWSAWKLGDDTAARAGRLTLNPLAHIDPIGTILLPLLQVPFGWAKPVPVNPVRFRRGVTMGTGMMITAVAGPLSNLILALLCTVGLGLAARFFPAEFDGTSQVAVVMLFHLISLNVGLAVFNLIPVPPLDGSRIVDGLMPYRLRPQWEVVVRFSPFLLVGVLLFGRELITVPISYIMRLLVHLIHAIAIA